MRKLKNTKLKCCGNIFTYTRTNIYVYINCISGEREREKFPNDFIDILQYFIKSSQGWLLLQNLVAREAHFQLKHRCQATIAIKFNLIWFDEESCKKKV